MIISINSAKYEGDYKISLSFNDGINRMIDFEEFLKKSKNPMSQKYLNKKLFKSFIVAHGDIYWNDYELCFPLWDLHEGRI